MKTFTYLNENGENRQLYFAFNTYVHDQSTALVAYEKDTSNCYFVSIWNAQKTQSPEGFWINSVHSMHLVQFLIKENFISVNRGSNCLSIIKDTAFFEGTLTEKGKKYLCLN